MAPLHVVLFFILGCGLGVVVHELGHWLCGVLVGIPIRLVRIGSGPDLAVFRVGETIVELRAILLSGLVSPYPVLEWKASAELLFVLGGVFANVALFAIVLALPRTPATPDWAIDAVWGIAWAQIGMVLSNLTPRTLHHGLQSDGALILALVSKGRPAFRNAADGLRYRAGLKAYARAREDIRRFSKASARIVYNLGRYRSETASEDDRLDACEALLRHLGRGGLRRTEEVMILDALVTKQVVDGAGPLHARLNALSLRAMDLAPDLATVRGTRGAALVEIGRFGEGRAMLAPLLEGPPSFDTILATLFCARAADGLGEREEVVRLLAAARAMMCFAASPEAARLLARVEARVAAPVT